MINVETEDTHMETATRFIHARRPAWQPASFLLFVGYLLSGSVAAEISERPTDTSGNVLLRNVRQVTFEGKRAGESYFSRDGSRMVFQSERDAGNPFYQIFLMDLETGDTRRVSPGTGKTTCAWIHPDGRILFASTHDDPDARQKQEAELEFRASGESRRYQWDYDENFELYLARPDGSTSERLTRARGYDAEGSISPGGEWIVFSSNRHAYTEALTPRQEELFKVDKAYMLDLYLMRTDGTQIERLTSAPGYDGGPFFSSDGRRICFRRFSEDGARAEIYTIQVDGSAERQLTRLGAMSWAPFFHPSGKYLIFTTNLHGFSNFELYLVDGEGRQEPVRVTHTDGFDGLPVFFPDGRRLAWTSNRTSNKSSQVFFADWDHQKALDLLFRNEGSKRPASAPQLNPAIDGTTGRISARDARLHVEYLASDKLEGRLTGSPGAKQAGRYIANYFSDLGLEPAGEDGSYFQSFEFTAGVRLGEGNRLTDASGAELEVNHEWRPLAFSKTGSVPASPLVFAGYGIVAPAREEQEEYDSYAHLDVEDKWVLVFRYLPEQVSPARRQHLSRHASLRYKAMVARDRGARGLLIVSGPNSKVNEQLVRLGTDASLAASGVAAISLTDSAAEKLTSTAGRSLKSLQDRIDSGGQVMGFLLPEVALEAEIDIIQEKRVGRNVVARLPVRGEEARGGAVLTGAHLDHLGKGLGASSLARQEERGQIHNGADDNASGTAGMLEVAQYLVDLKAAGQLKQRRDLLFAAWSGEELGILGSQSFVAWVSKHAETAGSRPLEGEVSAYLNMDMIGRFRERLSLQGVGSSSVWRKEIERRNVVVGLPITTSDDSYLPTDATSFYLAGVPVLSAFTGSHEDYHSPRDTADKINYEGVEKISRLMALIARSLVTSVETPDYLEQERPDDEGATRGLRVYLGTIPDYPQDDIKGVKLSGVTKGGPADKAGVRTGDVIVELAGRTIENIYDYTYAIDALKIGEPTVVVVLRDGVRMDLTVIPGSRE